MRPLKHEPETSPVGRDRRRVWAAGMLMTAVCMTGALALALAGTDGSFALWSDTASVDAGSLTSGTAELTAAWPAGHNPARWQNLLPGESIRQPVELTNAGAVPLAVAASTPTGSSGFELRVVAGTCGSAPLSGPALGGTPASVVTQSSPAVPFVLNAGTSRVACVEVRAMAAAVPAATPAFTILIDGTQAP